MTKLDKFAQDIENLEAQADALDMAIYKLGQEQHLVEHVKVLTNLKTQIDTKRQQLEYELDAVLMAINMEVPDEEI